MKSPPVWRIPRRFDELASNQEAFVKLSARNALKGTIEELHRGAVTTTVKIAVGGGHHITSSITNEAAEDLGLALDDQVTAIIKSSDVIIGK
jgi:molybdopterin-binding protein